MSGPRVAEAQRWLPPMGDKAKINVDGAVARHGHCGVAAAVCRDSTGLYLGSSLVVYAGIIDLTSLEEFACREALALAEDLGIQMMHVASDCEEVVKDIKQGSGGYHGAIIQEIIARKNDMISCTFTHERRVFNFEVHNLAKFGCNLGVGRHIWLGSPHDQNIVPLIIEQ